MPLSSFVNGTLPRKTQTSVFPLPDGAELCKRAVAAAGYSARLSMSQLANPHGSGRWGRWLQKAWHELGLCAGVALGTEVVEPWSKGKCECACCSCTCKRAELVRDCSRHLSSTLCGKAASIGTSEGQRYPWHLVSVLCPTAQETCLCCKAVLVALSVPGCSPALALVCSPPAR